MAENIEEFRPRTGRLIKEDGTIVNEADGVNADGSRDVVVTGSTFSKASGTTKPSEVVGLGAVWPTDGKIYELRADSQQNLLVGLRDASGNTVAGATGAAVPAGAILLGGSDSTNLKPLRMSNVSDLTGGNEPLAVGLYAKHAPSTYMSRLAMATDDAATFALGTMSLLWSGAAAERQRNNTEGTLLASAARTITATSPTIPNYNASALVVFINVTVAGTGSLTPVVRLIDPVSLQAFDIMAAVSITTTGTTMIVVGLGASGLTASIKAAISAPVNRSFDVWFGKSDGSSWTYSGAYGLIV